MRVTNSMLVSNFMNNLNTNLTSLSSLQQQLSSGKKFPHISDDPVSLIYSQQARYKLSRLADYQANVEVSNRWLTQAETGAMEINSIMQSAYESCIDAGTDIKNGADLTNIAQYIGQLKDQVLQALNTTFGDKYIFGGYNTTGYTESGKTVAPFTVNDDGNLCYNGVDLTSTDPADLALIEEMRKDVLSFDVAIGSSIQASVNGIELAFYGTDPDTGANLNIYNLLDDFHKALTYDYKSDPEGLYPGTHDPVTGINSVSPAEVIESFISDLQGAQNHTLAITADIGGRVKRLEILESRYEQDTLNYTQMLSDAEDIDFAEVIMNYKMAEAVYNAALSTGAYIIQPTLMDFLR